MEPPRRASRASREPRLPEQAAPVISAIQPHVDVAVAGDLELLDAFDLADGFGEFGSDGLGSSLQLPGELKGGRNGDLSKRGLFRLLGLNFARDSDGLPVERSHTRSERFADSLFQDVKHERTSMPAEDDGSRTNYNRRSPPRRAVEDRGLGYVEVKLFPRKVGRCLNFSRRYHGREPGNPLW